MNGTISSENLWLATYSIRTRGRPTRAINSASDSPTFRVGPRPPSQPIEQESYLKSAQIFPEITSRGGSAVYGAGCKSVIVGHSRCGRTGRVSRYHGALKRIKFAKLRQGFANPMPNSKSGLVVFWSA